MVNNGSLVSTFNSPMGTTTPTGRAFLQIQTAFIEMEHNIVH